MSINLLRKVEALFFDVEVAFTGAKSGRCREQMRHISLFGYRQKGLRL
ncbi:MAG: hypothetical protein IKX24_00735 [Prevotella sp.]|nr:hypothetical protein [Prevotella sp.]